MACMTWESSGGLSAEVFFSEGELLYLWLCLILLSAVWMFGSGNNCICMIYYVPGYLPKGTYFNRNLEMSTKQLAQKHVPSWHVAGEVCWFHLECFPLQMKWLWNSMVPSWFKISSCQIASYGMGCNLYSLGCAVFLPTSNYEEHDYQVVRAWKHV